MQSCDYYLARNHVETITINSFDGAINGIKSLINWKKTAPAKSNSPQTHKHLYFH
jgi:hypothetical protein